MRRIVLLLIAVACSAVIQAQRSNVPLEDVKQVADQQAQALWGDVQRDEPIAYYSKQDELIGYRFTYSFGNAFPDENALLQQCDQFRLADDEKAQWGIDTYGTMFVSCRSDMAVFQDYSKFLSPHYAFGQLMQEKAAAAIGGPVTLTRAYYINFQNQWFCYTNGSEEIYIKVFPEVKVVNQAEFHQIVDPLDDICHKGDFTAEWQSYLNGYFPDSPAAQVWIPNHDGNCKFYDWSYGCSPTAAAMLLSYWDYVSMVVGYSNYGKLIDWYFQRWDGIQVETDYQVPNTNKELAIAMGTDTVVGGGTDRTNIVPGYTTVTNTNNGYSFTNTHHDHGTDYVWYFDKIVSEIGTYSRPVHISIPGHSECCVAYDAATNMIGVHNTWNEGVQWISRTNLERVYTIVPGGASGAAVEMAHPMGDILYNHNGSGETFYAGDVFEIRWDYEALSGSYAKLSYSTNGGYNWTSISTNTPNDGVYDWNVPSGLNSTQCRIWVGIFNASNAVVSQDASIGNFKIYSGGSLTVLSEDAAVNTSAEPDYYQFTSNGYWNVVGVRNNTSGENWNIALFDNTSFTTELEESIYDADQVDYVLVDGNHASAIARGIKAFRASGTGSGKVEFEGGTDILTPDVLYSYSWPAGDVVEVWDIYLQPGYYEFILDCTSGSADLNPYLYGSTGGDYYQSRNDFLAYSSSGGAGADESFDYTVTTANYYGLVVWCKNANSANYTLRVETPGQWQGDVSNDWQTAANWSASTIPDASTDVTISPGYTYHPVISSTGDGNCQNLTIESGAKISIGSGDLHVNNDVTVHGEVEMNNLNADLNIGNDIIWESGSTTSITAGEIWVTGDWKFISGANVVMNAGHVIFEGPDASSIITDDADCEFYHLYNYKYGAGGYLFYNNSSTAELTVNGNLYNFYSDSRFFIGSSRTFILKGQFTNNGHIYGYSSSTMVFDGTAPVINLNTGDYLNHVTISTTGNTTLADSLRMNGDLLIESGTLVTNNHPILIQGDWTNNVGLAGFAEGTGLVKFTGSASSFIYTSETFYNLELDNTGSFYGLTLKEYVVCNDLAITDGCMELDSPASLLIQGNLFIQAGAGLNANDAYGPQIIIKQSWSNSNAGFDTYTGFNAGSYSRVTFNGTGDQYLTKSGTGEEFHDLRIDKTSGEFKPNDNITCTGDMVITDGMWDDNVSSLTHTCYGDFTVTADGAFFNAFPHNTVTFTGGSSSLLTYSSTSGYFYSLHINKTAGYYVTLVGNTSCQFDGTFTVDEGTWNQNGYSLFLSGNAEVNDGGVLRLPEGSTLKFDNASDLNINSGGTLQITGTPADEVSVLANMTGDYFDLNVKSGGTISAEHCIFEDMGIYGVNVQSGATVNTAHAFTGCTFRDGAPTCTLLSLNNDQTLTIRDAVFPANTWSGNCNVWKNVNTGFVYFVDYSGDFSGEAHDCDNFNRLTWVPTLTANASADPGSICNGDASQLHANPAGGLPPYSYIWSPAASLSNAYVENPVASPIVTTGYSVTVIDALGSTVADGVTVTVNNYVAASVSINASQNPSPPGTYVTYTATPVNGGPTPGYQWKVNGGNVGTGLGTYSYIPSYGDEVQCVMTSSLPCVTGSPATSNTITMIVVPVNQTVTGVVPSPLDLCFDATDTLTVAGGGNTFTVQSGGSVTMIAGMSILYLPGTTVNPGGYMHGYITTTNDFCGSLPETMVSVVTKDEPMYPLLTTNESRFMVYPNPTTGSFILAQKDRQPMEKIRVELFRLNGQKVLEKELFGEVMHEFSLLDHPAGIYILKVISGDEPETFKVIRIN